MERQIDINSINLRALQLIRELSIIQLIQGIQLESFLIQLKSALIELRALKLN